MARVREILPPWDSQPQEAVSVPNALLAYLPSIGVDVASGKSPQLNSANSVVVESDGIAQSFNDSTASASFADIRTGANFTAVIRFRNQGNHTSGVLMAGKPYWNQSNGWLFGSTTSVDQLELNGGNGATFPKMTVPGVGLDDGLYRTLVVQYVGTKVYVAYNGQYIDVATIAAAGATANGIGVCGYAYPPGGSNTSNRSVSLAAILDGSGYDIVALSANPWQLFAPRQILIPVSSGGGTTHATTGALTGAGSSIVGSAAHVATHATTGVLTGAGSSVVGSAARTREHPTSGVLTGAGSEVVGSAAHQALHTTSGALTGQGSEIVGAADHVVPGGTHATSGALVGPGSSVVGSAAHIATHASSGVLVGAGSEIAGSAARVAGAVTHATTGALIGQGSEVIGVARGPNPDAPSIELLGGAPGKPRKRRELAKDSYLYRLLSPPVEIPAEVGPQAIEAIEKVADKVVARQAKPRPSDVAASLKKLGIDYRGAYKDAYQEVYTKLVAQKRQQIEQQRIDDDDAEIAQVIAMLL